MEAMDIAHLLELNRQVAETLSLTTSEEMLFLILPLILIMIMIILLLFLYNRLDGHNDDDGNDDDEMNSDN